MNQQTNKKARFLFSSDKKIVLLLRVRQTFVGEIFSLVEKLFFDTKKNRKVLSQFHFSFS
ncbi:hypothetical protein EFY79_21100 [Hanamia caeni]|uniref:Uncharacterized protein n=1 Tax=Hanamia caeni TaxID=2294116 RepID=A0A3M9N1U4_9BACT|nr:hypothetical protein EFY79_21100 [Hanamia caeni]